MTISAARRYEQDLFDEAAFAYVSKMELSRWFRARGDCNKADDLYSEAQEIKNCIQIRELSGAWRYTRERTVRI